MKRGITVVIPTIPTREGLLDRAIQSVQRQTLQPYDIIARTDHSRLGAARTRQSLLMDVDTEWTAFLDDDDEMLPGHLEALLGAATYHGVDYVYSWYEVVGGTDPRPEEFGLPWDRDKPRQTTITTLVNTRLAQAVGGFLAMNGEDDDLTSPDRHYAGEDWRFTQRMNDAGRIYHLPVVTWLWHHHGRNTSGLPKW